MSSLRAAFFYAFKKADYIAFVVNHNVIEVPRGYSQKYRLDTGKRLIPLGRKCCRQLTFPRLRKGYCLFAVCLSRQMFRWCLDVGTRHHLFYIPFNVGV